MKYFNRVKLFVYSHKNAFVLGSVSFGVLFVLTFLLFYKTNNEVNELVYNDSVESDEINLKVEDDNLNKKANETVKNIYYIDIKGYVNNPGVYAMDEGNRVVDAINKAGGLKENANTSMLNLSMEIKDEMVIIVYSNDEINNYSEVENQNEIIVEICNTDIINDACICNCDDCPVVNNESTNSSESSSNESIKININTASKEELLTLSKIGESKANAIIEYRNKNGNFTKIEDIMNVSGIGEAIFEEIKDHITI